MWVYRGKEFVDAEEWNSMVYLITNHKTGKQYIGRKTFISSKTKQIKGKRKKIKSVSNWKSYWGSNKELLSDLKSFGQEHFSREILHLCKNKGSANYLEAKEIFVREALEKESWYNDWILCRISRTHIKIEE